MNYGNSNEPQQQILTAEDLQHHNMARKYAQNYIDNVLKYKSNGEMSTALKQEAKNRYNLHGNDRMLDNIVRNVALDPRVQREEFVGEGLTYVHVKVKPEYQSKDTPDYF
jgi:hypothetical protein